MGRSSELFAIAALMLLAFSFVSRFISTPGLGISIAWRGTGYMLPPSSISIGLATLLCFFGTIYSFWMLPFNRTATLLHFGLTAIGILVFWIAFYLSPNSRTAVWTVFAVPAAVLLVQLIFVWNLIQALQIFSPQFRSK